MDTQLEIMRDKKTSGKTKLDATNSILDRAGYKAVERREIVGAIGTIPMESRAVSEFAERARKLMGEKASAPNVVSTIDADVIDVIASD